MDTKKTILHPTSRQLRHVANGEGYIECKFSDMRHWMPLMCGEKYCQSESLDVYDRAKGACTRYCSCFELQQDIGCIRAVCNRGREPRIMGYML